MMELSEWATQYLKRNAKIKQWEIISCNNSDAMVKTSRATIEYRYANDLDNNMILGEHEKVIITLNTKKNVMKAQDLFDSINDKTRILFVHIESDSYWILNPQFIRNYADPNSFKKNPQLYVGETPYSK
ncbi:MAG: hypothetical protein ACMXYL_01935 [Candidatus Woesearchaeota archaeon]